MSVTFRGRRSIWRFWRDISVAPRIVNNVSYVMRINRESHFAWQAQHLVMLEKHLYIVPPNVNKVS